MIESFFIQSHKNVYVENILHSNNLNEIFFDDSLSKSQEVLIYHFFFNTFMHVSKK